MARIPEAEVERLRKEASVARLVEASGVALEQRGHDLAGHCPFHEDGTASLVITPDKNLWHCFGCGLGGGPIDWVMRRDKVSFRHAVERLRGSADPAGDEPGPRQRPASPVSLDADDQALLGQVIGYYHETLEASPEALAYLDKRGLNHPELILRFRLGYANRTLGYRLPSRDSKDGVEIRARLQRIGILRESGHEHLNGSLVVPILDEAGHVAGAYGRKITEGLRPGTAQHLYLPGPHKGVWNEAGLAEGNGEAILCEALIDAMSFWAGGFRHVTAAYGVHGFTPDHLAAFRRHGITRVLIAYDPDGAGNRAASALGEELIAAGFEVLRVVFPPGMDANAFACRGESLSMVLRQARWLGTGRKAEAGAAASEDEAAKEKAASSLAAELTFEVPADLPDELGFETGACRWRVRGWKKNPSPEALRVTLQVRAGDGYHMDALDLYSARARTAFLRGAMTELGLAEETIKRELGSVLLRCEAMQDALLAERGRPSGPAVPALGAEEETQALALLKAPDLPGRIVADLHALGMVGEDLNLLAAYLAAVSRKLDAPLAVLVQSSSAAGKSSLMDAVLALVPEEDRIRYSAMTGQSLYYLGETNLQHKVLAIAEEEGVRQAAYALKLLQSDGELTIASTGKDESTGNLVTKQYRVKGPVQLMLTTTAIDLDEELMNRCLVLSVDETAEQTAAIHERQRRRETLEGLLERASRAETLRRHHNAQRLLAGIAVVNPFADRLTFRADRTRSRRDHMKYLSLIRAVALLHQHQRPVLTVRHEGRELPYIEATKADIVLANKIAHEVLGRMLDELPPQTRSLLRLIRAMVLARAETERLPAAEIGFTRKDIREVTGWSDNQLKVHCVRLAELEYLLAGHSRNGTPLRYRLAWDGGGEDGTRHLTGLIDPSTLPDPVRSAPVGGEAQAVGPGLGPSWWGVDGVLNPGPAPKDDADQELDGHVGLNGSKPHIKRPAPQIAAVV